MSADLLNKIKNLIKRAFQTGSPSDSDYPSAQLSFMGQVKDVNTLTPYGHYSAPPKGSEWIVFSSRSNADDKWGIGNIFRKRYALAPDIDSLKEGETLHLNVLTGAYIFFKEDGTVELNAQDKDIDVITTADVNITAANLKITGDVDIDGNVGIDGNVDIGSILSPKGVTNNGVNIGSLHAHGGVTTGFGVSGPPV